MGTGTKSRVWVRARELGHEYGYGSQVMSMVMGTGHEYVVLSTGIKSSAWVWYVCQVMTTGMGAGPRS